MGQVIMFIISAVLKKKQEAQVVQVFKQMVVITSIIEFFQDLQVVSTLCGPSESMHQHPSLELNT